MRIAEKVRKMLRTHGRGLIEVEISDGTKTRTRDRLLHLYNRLESLDAEVRLEEARRQRNHLDKH